MTDPDRQLVRAVTRYSRAADDVEPPIRLQLARAEPDPQRRSGVVGWHFQVRRRHVPHFPPGALEAATQAARMFGLSAVVPKIRTALCMERVCVYIYNTL